MVIELDIKEKILIYKQIQIVNLERRQDRKEETIKKLEESGIDKSMYDFFNAVDGLLLELNIELRNIFLENDFCNRKCVIGCAMSHINLWKQLLIDENNEHYIIMEDDFTLTSNFKNNLEKLKEDFSNKELIFLGYHMAEVERNKCNMNDEKIIKVDPFISQLFIGGTFAYSINKKGAKKILDYILENGCKHGIDYVIKIVKDLQLYELNPQLVFSEWNEKGKSIDTDIQFNYDTLDFSLINNVKDNFIFFNKLDHCGNDIFFYKETLPSLMDRAEKEKDCIAFNTLGFFKNKVNIDTLVSSPYLYKKDDGIYIKKSYYDEFINNEKLVDKNLIRIKMICNWCSSEQLCKDFSNMCDSPDEFKWKNIKMVWMDNKEEIDYYIIINHPSSNEYFDPSKTIVFQMEPYVYDVNKNWGTKTWGYWANPDPNIFMEVRGRHTDHINNVFWQLELTLNQLLSIKIEKNKGNTISSICSSKYFDEGHIARIDLLKYIEAKNDPDVVIDIYNKDNSHNFKNYKGIVSPNIDKSKGMISYKYYFMIENNYEKNFITEKLIEPILCESLVFYYGCPNATDYINELAFVQLDVNDYEKSYRIIKQAIEEDWWSQRIDIIRQEKEKILKKLAFFPTIEEIIMKK
jgi:GR25 family glycosyltransferase involved in LPS biosynthesis